MSNTGGLPAVSFRTAFLYWLRLGFLNFGGPAGQIAMMHRDLVERRRWISEGRFLHALNFCMLLPGPEAQQLATYIGWLLHGTRGGLAAGALFVIPSVAVLLILSYVYAAHGNLPAVAGILAGLKPVIVAIVFDALLRIARRAIRRPAEAIIAVAAFVAIFAVGVPFPAIVLLAGLVGLVALRPGAEQALPPEAAVSPPVSRRARTLRIAGAGLLLWGLPLLLLVAFRGSRSLHVHLYRFFTQAALVTFGGAYAVLAYVMQAAVESYGWITRTQAVDGLALAESTPGPLIMVLQFVGFMAGWRNPEGMTPLTSAFLGAAVTTYTTFLPSFLFIFLFAPYVEALRDDRRLSAALAGITAAVVGVIANLGLVFGGTVLFPAGLTGGVDLFALILAAAALLALVRLRWEVLWVIAAGAAVGLLRTLLP